ncbi:MAG: DUF697 domain-containing protein [Leptolyngbya sp. SIO1E4]|nr:DUF697 domain-containing protein [Leptolyngbya sp. SIO1E4]
MIQKLLSERPILVGGLGLAAGLSLLGGLQDVLFDDMTLMSLMAAGAGVWWWRRQRPAPALPHEQPVELVARDAVEATLADLHASLSLLRQEMAALDLELTESLVSGLESQRQRLLQELDRSTLQVAIAGPSRSGKTTLISHLGAMAASPTAGEFTLTEVALTAEGAQDKTMASLIQHQDAVVYLVTEDLTESALADLRTLTTAGQRVVLSLNKQDNYLPDERVVVVEQLTSRLQRLPQPVEVAAIATAPKAIKVRTHTADGQVEERLEPQSPDVAPITAALKTWLAKDVAHLVAQTVMRQTHQLRRDIQGALNQARRAQALPVVEQLQWTAAATAFASPVPSLDLLATLAISGQLVMDLGRIYQQPLSLDQAKTIASELAAIVVKLGLVEVSTQLLTTALKSHAATYVVGGSVQAFSAAYLTRLSGESLMAYFEDRALSGQIETALSVDAIGQKLQTLLPSTQRVEFLQTLVKQGIQKLTIKSSPGLAAAPLPSLDLPENTLAVAGIPPEAIRPGEPV